jgi:hypothetical protein
VAFGSKGCKSKEDPVDSLEKRGDILKGGIGFSLRFILAERCKTAKEWLPVEIGTFKDPDWSLRNMDVNSASSLFRLLNSIGDAYYFNNHKMIREVFDKYEADMLEKQGSFEKEVMELYKKDRNKAIEYLTEYTNSQAIRGFKMAKGLVSDFINE